jgi:hypothetical protein
MHASRGAGLVDSTANIPFPFDHFFFCFLPPVVAAGACDKMLAINKEPEIVTATPRIANHVDDR